MRDVSGRFTAAVACETGGYPRERCAEAFDRQFIKCIEPGSNNCKEIANGSVLHCEGPIHIGLAERKRGAREKLERQRSAMKLDRNRGSW
ncbi:hypothetical protein GCM10023208_33410 [Erythrobacter westpacificensis]|uniref:Uncharacterized protein n=1 Tax=Erythrobacter westpacificensis TaxID=1055231 RepID=A0ABP9KP79_9SPHN